MKEAGRSAYEDLRLFLESCLLSGCDGGIVHDRGTDHDGWIIDNEVSDSRLRQFSFLKQDTGELIPLHDEDDYSN